MAFSVEMPELGESVTEGTITRWLKAVGDAVETDEPLLEVSTDKVDTEIPSPAAGVLLKILFEEDDTVDVGAVIAEIGEAGETPAEEPEPEVAAAAPTITPTETASATPTSASTTATTDIVMPELGESVTEGTITRWLKNVGDTVETDEPLLEVSTDKVDTEVPSPVSGTIVEILFSEDDTVDVGTVIVRVGDGTAVPAEPAPTPVQTPTPAPEPTPVSVPKPEKVESTPTSAASVTAPASKQENANDRIPYVTPLVRKLADKHGIDLRTLTGTGVGGRIRKQDVVAVVEQANTAAPTTDASTPGSAASTKGVDPAKAALRGTTQKVNRIREITAKKTLESLHSAAQLTQVHEVDMTKVAELRKANKPAFQAKHGVNLTYLPFFAKAIIEALVAHPNVNASYNAETKEMTYHSHVNLGIAVDTPAGLLSPVIHDAQDMSLPQLAQAIVDIADRARNNNLKPTDLMGGTFTITNIGSEGALTDTPILVPPQAAMIGTGAIVKRPVVISDHGSDAIAIRQMVLLPMTYDHQIVDGADAGRFMTTVRDRLETADFLGDLEL